MTALQKLDARDEAREIVTATESAAMISMIERAARDPNVDVDKMMKLLEMKERVEANQAKKEYARALAQMQPRLPEITERGGIKDKSGGVQSTYAKWEDVNEAIRPILSERGFALSFRISHPEGKISVTGVLSHEEGHSEETTITLPHDSSGSKNAVQAVGSSVSYGKRYTAFALLNITTRGEDDDGKRGGGSAITPEQLEALQSQIVHVGADVPRFLAYLKIERLEDLPAKDFDRAMTALRNKEKRS